MTAVTDRVERLSEDVAKRLAQLAATAAGTGSAVGEESRQRAAEALAALRGRRRARWRWLLAGAVVGFVAGMVTAGLAPRSELPLLAGEDTAHGLAETVRDKGRAAGHMVQEKARPVREAREKSPDANDESTSTDKDE